MGVTAEKGEIVILRVKIPGALYRLSLHACGERNSTLNKAICRLLEHDDWLETVVDEIAQDAVACASGETI
jgi:hypothetical protein|tara:strand:+ start:663 stop:875 length:213 start_codon:yes stop_codon:yes gene_type:complete